MDRFKRAVDRAESRFEVVEAAEADRDNRIEELEKKVISLDNRLKMLESRVTSIGLGFHL